MKLVRYPFPLQPFREWENLLEDSFRAFAPLLRPTLPRAGESADRLSGVEWFEDNSHFHVRIDLPGVKKEHLRLEVEEGFLRLVRETLGEPEKEGGAVPSARAEFVLRCPEGVRGEGVDARLSDGVLQVSLPKAAPRRTVEVSIS